MPEERVRARIVKKITLNMADGVELFWAGVLEGFIGLALLTFESIQHSVNTTSLEEAKKG